MRYLITGGAGFIGYHLARLLAERGDGVVLVDDLSRGKLDKTMSELVEQDEVEFQHADLTTEDPLAGLDGPFDGVVHLAAVLGVQNVQEDPLRVLSVNSRALFNVLEWYLEVGGSGTFLFSSTSEVYAWTRRFHDLPVPTPEDVPLAVDRVDHRRACYAVSKILGEMAVVHGCGDAGVRWISVRYHNIYGPRMGEAHVIPEVYRRVHRGQDPLKVYNVDHRRAFCHVDDAVRATAVLLDSDAPPDIYNVGNDQDEVTIGKLARMILQLAGCEGVAIEPVESNAAGVERRCPDISRLREATGFRPEVSLQEGLRSTLAWYARIYDAERADA